MRGTPRPIASDELSCALGGPRVHILRTPNTLHRVLDVRDLLGAFFAIRGCAEAGACLRVVRMSMVEHKPARSTTPPLSQTEQGWVGD
jgi:hypothetical protein